MDKDFNFPDLFPLHDVPTPDQNKIYAAIISMKQEEYSHLNGNPKDLMKFEECVSWQELTRSIDRDRCSNKCLPVILQSFFGQRNDLPKCNDPMEHGCMMLASLEKLVSKGYTKLLQIKAHSF